MYFASWKRPGTFLFMQVKGKVAPVLECRVIAKLNTSPS
jgi:hypothetical protein